MARIDEVRERYESITEQLYKNRDTFAEYLKFAESSSKCRRCRP